jgi:phosphotransferase system enzyme I (PtsI)
MITTVAELRWAKSIIEEVKAELRGESVSFAEDMPIGIMIEVPAAAMMADSLARETDFFSIGTNDLIQYTLAVDRTNERVAHMFTAAEPAVLRLIRNVIDAAQRHDVDVSMCGEMAGDPVFVKLLVGMGLKTLSVAPAQAPQIKKLIRTVSMDEARALADSVFGAESREDVMVALDAQAVAADVQFPGDTQAAQD